MTKKLVGFELERALYHIVEDNESEMHVARACVRRLLRDGIDDSDRRVEQACERWGDRDLLLLCVYNHLRMGYIDFADCLIDDQGFQNVLDLELAERKLDELVIEAVEEDDVVEDGEDGLYIRKAKAGYDLIDHIRQGRMQSLAVGK